MAKIGKKKIWMKMNRLMGARFSIESLSNFRYFLGVTWISFSTEKVRMNDTSTRTTVWGRCSIKFDWYSHSILGCRLYGCGLPWNEFECSAEVQANKILITHFHHMREWNNNNNSCIASNGCFLCADGPQQIRFPRNRNTSVACVCVVR